MEPESASDVRAWCEDLLLVRADDVGLKEALTQILERITGGAKPATFFGSLCQDGTHSQVGAEPKRSRGRRGARSTPLLASVPARTSAHTAQRDIPHVVYARPRSQSVCNKAWKRGSIAYRCLDCEVDPSAAVCPGCFQAHPAPTETTTLTPTLLNSERRPS